jgi:oligopeptide/dipeptide ABC transporter ATP-binding protein
VTAAVTPPGTRVLEVEDLNVEFYTRRGIAHAVRGVSFHVERGETLGIVGESGSGKSVTVQAAMGLTELPGKVTSGDVRILGQSILHGPAAADHLRKVRGKDVAMVFQDPMTSLNPLLTIGTQLREVLRRHMGMSKKAATVRSVELLELVGISFPKQRVKQYPHELSGGMRQRVLIAMALSCEPALLIADEPTTALDVTIQAQVLDLIAELRERLSLAVLLITHDLGVVAGVCDRVAVMYGGKLVESGPADDVFATPGHPYAKGLLRSTPRLDVVLPRLVAIDGAPPDLMHPPDGCPFAPRCTLAVERCADEMPPLLEQADKRHVACWRAFGGTDDVRPDPEPELVPAGGGA